MTALSRIAEKEIQIALVNPNELFSWFAATRRDRCAILPAVFVNPNSHFAVQIVINIDNTLLQARISEKIPVAVLQKKHKKVLSPCTLSPLCSSALIVSVSVKMTARGFMAAAGRNSEAGKSAAANLPKL